ncbi:cytochrome P450 [Actinokineospora enzanensis]|uniref:cytochrome P450 n=1 Tax=Actinokineospora enzanensis TaxID=155975 RepID=UPI000373216C|nr:cytochrome P450 [Actinokineospora enzanensis]
MTAQQVRAGAHPLFDPLDQATLADPYPAYRRLRDEDPVAYLPDYDMWMVTRYEDATRVARDPAAFSSKIGMSPDFERREGPSTGVNYRIGGPKVRVLIATDPPEHQVFRRAVAKAFSPGSVGALKQRIAEIARDRVGALLDHRADGTSDFFSTVAEPAPVSVLAELLGVPEHMHERFRGWSTVITTDLDQVDGLPDGVGRGMDMFRYFSNQLRNAGAGERPTLFDAIGSAGEAGVSTHELLAFCAFLLVAGIETTTNLLTNLMGALLRFPDVQQRLREHPELIPGAVDEAIRYDTPVQALWRGTTGPVRLGERDLPADARVLVVWGSANRDERKFPRPDLFVPERSPNEHVGFGAGPHYCLGARLAVAEVTAVLSELLARTSRIEPAGEPTRTHSLVLRGMTDLPVRAVPR